MSSVYDILLDEVPLLGFDSFVARLVIGPLLKRWQQRAGLATWFGVCDGAASLIGGTLPHVFPDIPDVVLYGICVVAVALAARRSRKWLFASPFILALDNLATGSPATAVPILAVTSGLLALVGMTISTYAFSAAQRLYRRVTPPRVAPTKG